MCSRDPGRPALKETQEDLQHKGVLEQVGSELGNEWQGLGSQEPKDCCVNSKTRWGFHGTGICQEEAEGLRLKVRRNKNTFYLCAARVHPCAARVHPLHGNMPSPILSVAMD